MTPARRRLGWLTAASLLVHGWLPVVLGATLVASHGGDRYAPPDVPICAAAAASPRPSRGPECPVTHDQICLCAIFVGALTPVQRAGARPAASAPERPAAPAEPTAGPILAGRPVRSARSAGLGLIRLIDVRRGFSTGSAISPGAATDTS